MTESCKKQFVYTSVAVFPMRDHIGTVGSMSIHLCDLLGVISLPSALVEVFAYLNKHNVFAGRRMSTCLDQIVCCSVVWRSFFMYARSNSVSKAGLTGCGDVASERDAGERKPYEVDISLPTRAPERFHRPLLPVSRA